MHIYIFEVLYVSISTEVTCCVCTHIIPLIDKVNLQHHVITALIF